MKLEIRIDMEKQKKEEDEHAEEEDKGRQGEGGAAGGVEAAHASENKCRTDRRPADPGRMAYHPQVQL